MTSQTRQSAAGSDSGSPWTRTKSAGPPSRRTPASGSPSSVAAVAVAAASACQGSRPAVDQALDLPGELVGPGRAAAEVRTGGDERRRRAGQPHALVRPLPPRGDRAARVGEPRRSWSSWRTCATTQHRQRRDHRDVRWRHRPRRCPRRAGSRARCESTPASAPTRAPGSSPECAVTRGPAPVRRLDRGADLVHGERRGVGVRPVQVELHQVGAVVELAGRRGDQSSPSLDLEPSPPGSAPVRATQVPAARTYGYSRRPAQRSRTPSASARVRPSTGSTPVGEPTSRAQRTPGRALQPRRCARPRPAAGPGGRTRGRSSALRPAGSGGCGCRPSRARSCSRRRPRPRRRDRDRARRRPAGSSGCGPPPRAR